MRSIYAVHAFSSPKANGFLVGEFHVLSDQQDKELVDQLLDESDQLVIEGEVRIPDYLCSFSDSNPDYLKHKEQIDALRQEHVPKVLACMRKIPLLAGWEEVEKFFASTNPYPLFKEVLFSLLVDPKEREGYLKEAMQSSDKLVETSIVYAKSRAESAGKTVNAIEKMEEKIGWIIWQPDQIEKAYKFFSFDYLSPADQKELGKLFREKRIDREDLIRKGSQDEDTSKRDKRFIAEIASLSGRPLVMLGAAHLPGVISSLEKQGYSFQARYSP